MIDTCTLCDLPLAETGVESDDVDSFCCRGCLHVHETPVDRDDVAVEDGLDVLDTGYADRSGALSIGKRLLSKFSKPLSRLYWEDVSCGSWVRDAVLRGVRVRLIAGTPPRS